MEILDIKAFDGALIPVAFFPHDDPKGLFQIIHGSLEHKARYYDLCEFLNRNGYAVVISDHRGHGEFINEKYPQGHFNGLEEVLEDLLRVTAFIKGKYPGKELSLLGHSLGSQLARVYIQNHDEELKNLILTGTVCYKRFAWAGPFLCDLMAFFKGGYDKPSQFLRKVSGLDKDQKLWISYSQENLKRKSEDKMFAKEFTIGGYQVVFQSNNEIRKVKHYRCKNPSLRILSLNGDGDFLTGYDKGLTTSMNYLKKAGYASVSYKRYDHMLHEVLNEDDHQKVYDDILNFLEGKE